jgi:argininosuccinate lyase
MGTDESLRLWGGAFSRGPAQAMAALSASVHFDWVLAPYDLLQGRAHARVLHRAGLLTDEELQSLLHGIAELDDDVRTGSFVPTADDEDVHTALERGLVERLGADLGGRLRAGRSRNDQVATDFRLYLRDHARLIASAVGQLQDAILEQAQVHVETAAPGFTHLQHAQPVSFGHELAKHVHAFARDVDRLRDWDRRNALSPMGAGALAGSSLPLDPMAVAKELGFTGVLANSIDAVSDRDFVTEFLFCTASIGIHLSRLGEEMCLWASREFGWMHMDDAFSTGSSLMPQKRNPDAAELARGKAGRLIGSLTAVLAMTKGLPFAYNRDLQEDKEPVFDAVATLLLVLPAMEGAVRTATFDVARMAASAPEGFTLATDIAEWLVRGGVPFREAHDIAGGCVRTASDLGVGLEQLTPEQLASVDARLTPAVREVLTVEGALAARNTINGTAPARVREQIAQARKQMQVDALWSGQQVVPSAT